MKHYTPREAAAIIGCSPQQIRTLIRTKKIRARVINHLSSQHYQIPASQVVKYAKTTRTGWPRGKKRKEQ